MPIKAASELLGINKHTAKTIMHIYKVEGRIKKKQSRNRKVSRKVQIEENSVPKNNLRRIEEVSQTEPYKSTECIHFSFDIYKKSIENEYANHLRIRNEEMRRRKKLALPIPFGV